MIDGKYILDAILSSMTKDEKVSLLAKLTTEVGNLQPDDETLTPGTEIPERKIEGERITVTLPEQPVLDEVADAEEPVTGEVEFAMVKNPKKKIEKKGAPKVSVGDNTFVDDGSLHKGEGYTPPPKPAAPRQRRPPAKKIKQTCKRCSKTYSVHSVDAREWYICPKCQGGRR